MIATDRWRQSAAARTTAAPRTSGSECDIRRVSGFTSSSSCTSVNTLAPLYACFSTAAPTGTSASKQRSIGRIMGADSSIPPE